MRNLSHVPKQHPEGKKDNISSPVVDLHITAQYKWIMTLTRGLYQYARIYPYILQFTSHESYYTDDKWINKIQILKWLFN